MVIIIKPDVDAKSIRLDVYVRGRHVYTFANVCKEDTGIALGGEAVKMFLNADSEMDDVSRELAAFLDYVAGSEISAKKAEVIDKDHGTVFSMNSTEIKNTSRNFF